MTYQKWSIPTSQEPAPFLITKNMAIKAEIEFKVYQDGLRIDSVTATTMVNDPDKLLQKIQEQTSKAHPEVMDASIVLDEKHLSIGVWYLAAQEPKSGKTFLLLISRLN